MKQKLKNEDHLSQFDWLGLGALLFGIEIPIRLLASTLWNEAILQIFLIACLVVLIVFISRYDWKNISVALLLICTIHPVRIMPIYEVRVISSWWANSIFYTIVTLICILILMYGVQRYRLKNNLIFLLVVCGLLSGWQAVVSTMEVGHCYVDDLRWTHYVYCETTHMGYQQIERLPIGMRGYCYYCPWYYGVRRWSIPL